MSLDEIDCMKMFNLKGNNKYETGENWAILSLVIGVVMLAGGIGISIVNPKGISAILAMLGSFVSFIATIVLIFIWLAKEFFSE
jgi:hypothetical protein